MRVGDQVQLNIYNISIQRPIKLLNYKNLGPYQIKQVIDRGAIYKLKLLPTLATCRIQPVFHLWLLYLYQPNPLSGQIQPEPPLVLIRDENEDENYEEQTVKRIIDSKYFSKGRGRRLYYRAIYTGFDIDQPEWQLQEDFKNVKDLISDFYYANLQKPGLSRDFVPNPLQEPLQS